MPYKETIRFKLDYHADGAKVETVAAFITSIQELGKVIQIEVGMPYAVEVRVPEIRKGSVDVETIWALSLAGGGIDIAGLMEHVQLVGAYVGPLLKQALNLKKFLGGKKHRSISPVEGDNNMLNVINADGDVMNVSQETINITYNNPVFNGPVYIDSMRAIENDEEASHLSISDIDGTTVFDRKDFGSLSHKIEPSDIPEQSSKTTRVKVKILTAVIDKEDSNKKWHLMYLSNGGKINAKMMDKDFLKRAVSGAISFKNGDILDIDLCTDFAIKNEAYPEPIRHTVVKVHDMLSS